MFYCLNKLKVKLDFTKFNFKLLIEILISIIILKRIDYYEKKNIL